LQRAHPGTIRRFLLAHHCRKEDWIEERIQAIYAAVPATTDAVVIEAASRKTTALLSTLRPLQEAISALDKRIAAVVADHPDAPIFASFPGAGSATVPRLIAAFGTCREAWASAAHLQCFSGIAPVHKSSGKSVSVVMRRACPKFLRQTFHEFAGQSIPFCQWAKAYYNHQRQNRKASHHAAVRSLAFRWMRILYRCWKDRQPYNEDIYVAAQRRRNSLLTSSIDPGLKLSCETVAGFHKLTGSPAVIIAPA